MNSFFSLLSDTQFIALEGEKAADFLQGQVTCDVREITETKTRRGAHCSSKGRVLSTFRVFKFAGQLYLTAPAAMKDLIIGQFKKYAVFSKVSLCHTETLQAIGCVGKEMYATLQQLFGQLPEEPDQAIFSTRNMMLVRVQATLPRFEAIGTLDAIDHLRTALAEKYPLNSNEQWRLLDIQAAVATIYPETQDLFTPHMLNYPALNAVSFKKGCYIGQEVVARTHYLGKAKRHLALLNLQSPIPPKPGDPMHDANGKIVGTVVDYALATNQYQLLAVLQDESTSEDLFWKNTRCLLI
jgi:folate-binding protein YgfZ